MEVKPEELRIGNLMETLEGKITAVTGIVAIDFFNSYTFWCYGYKAEDVRPIKLTEEKLLSLGFIKEKCALGLSDTFWYSGIGLNHVLNERFSVRNTFNTYVLLVHHVHELQNLVFALNKEELPGSLA